MVNTASYSLLKENGKKHVVIIGGGSAGRQVAEGLIKSSAAKANVTLIQADHFYENQIAGTYTLTRPETHVKAVAPIEPNMIKGVNYVIDVVTELDHKQNKITMKSGKTLEYDYVVICTGYSVPCVKPQVGATWEERKKEIARYSAAIKNAKSVLILGGGAISVELAGDVRDVNEKGKITIVSRDGVLKGCSEYYRQKTADILKGRKIDVFIDELEGDVHNSHWQPSTTKRTYTLQYAAGKSIEADVLLPGYARMNSDFLSHELLENGRVKVNAFFQNPDVKNIFACGCSNNRECLSEMKILGQVSTVVKNVSQVLAGKEPSKEHVEMAPFMKVPYSQKIGADYFAFLDKGNLPPGLATCAYIGFPFCPPPCCWFCCCHPFCCGKPCSDPEGKELSQCFKKAKFMIWSVRNKKTGETDAYTPPETKLPAELWAPTQEKMNC